MSKRLTVDWSKSAPCPYDDVKGMLGNWCPKVTGPRGGRVRRMYDVVYADATLPPHYPVPAIANPLYVIAAMPCDPVTDFIDIGYYGKYWK